MLLLPCSVCCSTGSTERNSRHYAVEHSADDSDNGRYRRDNVASFFVHICWLLRFVIRKVNRYITPCQNFFQKKSPKLLRISILFHNFAIATIIVRSTPHRQRARIYVQARPTFLIGYGLIFLPVTCRICTGYALCLCGALRIVWRCNLKIYGGSPSTCFYCPLRRKALLL